MISPEEGLVLQFAYTREGTIFSSIAKQFAIHYGLSITHKSLRDALLAFSTGCLPSPQFRDAFEYHKNSCLQTLITKLRTPSSVEEADIFAAFVLVETLFSHNPDEISIHTAGCVAIFEEFGKQNLASDFLSNISPWILTRVNFIRLGRDRELPKMTLTLSELSKCFEYLRGTGIPRELWRSGFTEALNDVFIDWLHFTLRWFAASLRQHVCETSERDLLEIAQWSRCLVARGCDLDLHFALQTAEKAFWKDSHDIEEIALAYQFAVYQAIVLLVDICGANFDLTRFKAAREKIHVDQIFKVLGLVRDSPRFSPNQGTDAGLPIIASLIGLALDREDIRKRNRFCEDNYIHGR